MLVYSKLKYVTFKSGKKYKEVQYTGKEYSRLSGFIDYRHV
jgi:hypothetical protein